MFVFSDSGPSSIDPQTNKPFGSSFPMFSVEDLVRAQFQLVKHLGIEKVIQFRMQDFRLFSNSSSFTQVSARP